MTLNVIPMPNKVKYYGGTLKTKEVGISYITDEAMGDEAYSISILESNIIITSKGAKGRFYAEKTLGQLFNRQVQAETVIQLDQHAQQFI